MGQNLDLTTAHVDPSKTLVISIDNNTDFADAVKKLHNGWLEQNISNDHNFCAP